MSTHMVWPAASNPYAGGARGKVVLVCGGRRGVGVSTLAAMLALVLGGGREDVLLLDAGGGESLYRLFGIQPPAESRRASWEDLVDERLVWAESNLALLGLDTGRGDASATAARLTWLRAQFPLIVVDAGSRLATVLEVAGAGIDQLLCVTSEDPAAAAGAYALSKVLSARQPAVPVGMLVNQAQAWAAREVEQQLRTATVRFLGKDLYPLVSVPVDDCLRAGIAAGMTMQEVVIGSPAALALYDVGIGVREGGAWHTGAPALWPARPLPGSS